MAPVLLSTTAAAAAATAGHRLVARKESQGDAAGIALGTISGIWIAVTLFWAARVYRQEHRNQSWGAVLCHGLSWLLACVVFLAFFWCIIPYKLFSRAKKKREQKRQWAAVDAANRAARAASAARVAAEPVVAQPPPWTRATMPLDPIELAPEEPGLGDPDDVAALHRPAAGAPPPPPSPPAYGEEGPTMPTMPAPAYHPVGSGQG